MDLGIAKNILDADGKTININNFRVQRDEFHPNATLRQEEWKEIDDAVIKAYRERLRGVADLYAKGLVRKLSNGLSRTVLEYEVQSDIDDAEMDMDGINRTKSDRVVYTKRALPLPIIHKDFHFGARILAMSRNVGDGLDVTNAELNARKVAEYSENLLFNGSSSFEYGGGTIYGYTDYPSRNTQVLAKDWAAVGTTGEEILFDVKTAKQKAIDDRCFGPYVIYIPTAYETKMDLDFKDASDKTIRQRLLEVGGITDVKVADHLSNNNVLLIQMTSDVVRLIEGMPLTNVEWSTEGKMMHHFKVMTILVPQIRSDADNRCGIVHMVHTP